MAVDKFAIEPLQEVSYQIDFPIRACKSDISGVFVLSSHLNTIFSRDAASTPAWSFPSYRGGPTPGALEQRWSPK